jgi:hypothetical protein
MSSKSFAIGALIAATALSGCAGMTETERRTTTGAALGGAAAGLISGEWGWAAAGAAVGAAGGYLYDQHKKSEEDAYQRGLRDGKTR